MFVAIWAWVGRAAKWLLKRCTKQWYLVEIKTSSHNDWGEYYPTRCSSLMAAKRYLTRCSSLLAAKRYLTDVTDTCYWLKCRILNPDGRVVDETVANDFYGAPMGIVFMYVETNMTCAEAMEIWRRQQLKDMDSRKCSDVQQ
jgi:hypothetical protein